MDTIVTKLKPLDWTVFWQKQKDETQVLKVCEALKYREYCYPAIPLSSSCDSYPSPILPPLISPFMTLVPFPFFALYFSSATPFILHCTHPPSYPLLLPYSPTSLLAIFHPYSPIPSLYPLSHSLSFTPSYTITSLTYPHYLTYSFTHSFTTLSLSHSLTHLLIHHSLTHFQVVASGLLLRKAVVMSAAKKNFQTLEELTQCMRCVFSLISIWHR